MATLTRDTTSDFIGKVYGLTGLGIGVAALSSLLFSGTPLLSGGGLVMNIIASFALLFGIYATRGVLAASLFVLFCALDGPLLGPIVTHYAKVAPGIVEASLAMTALTFGVLTAYVFQTKQNFSAWGGSLLIALVALVGASIAGLFLPIPQVLLGAAGVVIFSLLILFDTGNIVAKAYDDDEYAWAAVALYLDVVNLFLSILKVFASFSSND